MLAALARLPQGALSRGAGMLADAPIPRPMRRRVLSTFARTVGIDLSEVELPLEEYRSIGDFFVRRLRPDARAWPDRDGALASPVDGIVGRFGRIERGRVLQAKGRDYSVGELLGGGDAGERYDGGTFVTLYLSPRHYHRIHAPCGGDIALARHIPGALLPVNAAAVSSIPDLFARNERLVCWIEGPLGRVAVVAVGAYNVGRIAASFERLRPEHGADPQSRGWRTNVRGAPGETRRYDPPIAVRQGDEIMAFHLGSTVVLLLEPHRAALSHSLAPGTEVPAGSILTEGAGDSAARQESQS
ncbi:MAG TPA: archaetidylserine decarboxylase [Longimicrobiales bacterium]|nr:archaetidylserine decarboxylase [Longimicrobiales bacterium]